MSLPQPRAVMRRHAPRRTIGHAASDLDIAVALQPIIDVATGAVVAAEALARFPTHSGSSVSVEETFAAAHAAGRGDSLEAACLRSALARRAELPAGVLLSVNVSPDALGHRHVQTALRGDLFGVVVEVTEQVASQPVELVESLFELRRRGALIAVDDASKGHSGLHRLAALRPDIVKLDRTLVSGVRDSLERTAIVEAIVSLCRRLGSQILGEGIESLDDLAALGELDVDYAQGNVIAPPRLAFAPAEPSAVETCQAVRRELLRGRAPDGLAGSIQLPGSRWRSDEPLNGAGMPAVTAALAGLVVRDDLKDTLAMAAGQLQVDALALSVLDDDRRFTELASTADSPDPGRYRAEELPATSRALSTGSVVEVHLGDPDLNPVTEAVLTQRGAASVLLAPLVADGVPLGVLQLGQRQPTRWRSRQVAQARSLADHIALVLLRVGGAPTRRRP